MRNGIIAAVAIMIVSSIGIFAEQVGEYFREEQNIGKMCNGLGGSTVSIMAAKLPYAYYPSKNKMEVAIELSPELLKKAGTHPESVEVQVIAVQTGQQCATVKVLLDKKSQGQGVFDIPDLPDGEYAVEYVIGKHVERSPKTFKRIHFPFEKISYGVTHEVYPPFESVKVNGKTVYVVGRTYTVNDLGLFDSVTSLGRELLAAPMRFVAEGGDGKRIEWQAGNVNGKTMYPDLAEFECEAKSAIVNLKSKISIEEDGCAKIALTLTPDTRHPVTVFRLWLEIPLKDSEVPLFHYIADNGMRLNYAGKTPRGGKIEWFNEKWDGQVPQRWRLAKAGSSEGSDKLLRHSSVQVTADGIIWTSNDIRQHGNVQRSDHRPFVPYIWLGAEERGLAFFMENEKGFATDYKMPVQKVIREGDSVIIRVEIFQQPVTLTEARTITFGLMASPGKPMEKEFRTRPFASGIGPVVCWGGWQCASKYPDNQDWSIVDKIQEIRKRGQMNKEDESWFEAKYSEVKVRWPDRMMQNDPKSPSWLASVKLFAQRAGDKDADTRRRQSGIYFEEHATDILLPEWEVFQDEWASAEFNRFRDKPANWGVFSPSYHNFVLYMANEWMKRGVSLYFDNTEPKRCYNELFGPAYRTPNGSVVYGITIFGQREYYRRIYKLLSEWNRRGVEYPIDFTQHITNTQTLPFNTWATATLDLEQRAQTEDPDKVTAEVVIAKKDEKSKPKPQGYQLPWPPDYTRTVTFGRQSGTIPLVLDLVSGHLRHDADQYTTQMMLRDWAMRRIHDIRKGGDYMKSANLAKEYENCLIDFGYGKLDQVTHHNYWAEKPFVSVDDDRVKWLALEKKVAEKVSGVSVQNEKAMNTGNPEQKTDTRHPPARRSSPGEGGTPDISFGLLLLQSYSRTEAVNVAVTFPGAAVFQDVETKEIIPAPGGKAQIAMPANFATRMFLVSRNAEALKSSPTENNVQK